MRHTFCACHVLGHVPPASTLATAPAPAPAPTSASISAPAQCAASALPSASSPTAAHLKQRRLR